MNKYQGKIFIHFVRDEEEEGKWKIDLGRNWMLCPSYNSLFWSLRVREDITITVTINKNGKIYSVFVLFPSYFLSHCCSPFSFSLYSIQLALS
jgi:hypothetical protein